MNKTKLLAVGTALLAGALFAVPQTRSDIEGMTFPAGWNISKRTTYQVEVGEKPCVWLDSRLLSVEERFFDLDSMPFGLLLFLR